MSTDLLSEVDLDALIDMSAEVPCMWPDKCETTATWKMTNLCAARHGYTLCTPHKNIEQANDARMMLASPLFTSCTCGACGEALPRPFCEWSKL